jgi:hypothetical protein
LDTIDVENLVFVDECGIDRELQRGKARAERGARVNDTISGQKFARVNTVAALSGERYSKKRPSINIVSRKNRFVKHFFSKKPEKNTKKTVPVQLTQKNTKRFIFHIRSFFS